MGQGPSEGLLTLTGREVTLRFPNAGITGRVVSVEREPWGYLLHLISKVGDHYVAYPGDVLQIVVPNRDLQDTSIIS